MRELLTNECGQSTTEYVLLLAALVLLVVGALGLFGSAVYRIYDESVEKIVNAGG